MHTAVSIAEPALPGISLLERFKAARGRTVALVAPLSAEDACVQSMPDASPAKWHLAHTSWFFENFVLADRAPAYKPFHERFSYLFNSYYFTVGQMHLRPRRGLLTRPSLPEILDYRAYVDAAVEQLLEQQCGDATELDFLLTLGIHHEAQHQELLLTDIKHLLAQNPLLPAYLDLPPPTAAAPATLEWIPGAAGEVEIGHGSAGFAFDNETPRHCVLLQPHSIASRPVTNAEYREFIRNGGYRDPALWLSDGWATVLEEAWTRPLYWQGDLEQEFTLGGLRPIEPAAPVCHLSYFEADAFARWTGTRLPTEAEWEAAASCRPIAGHFADSREFQPRPPAADGDLKQLYGDVWEWTASPYAPYPGFRPLAGSLGEYNGKFMCSQMVLRGGSCATPVDHVRPSYRNFFYPRQRWQYAGLRLARDDT
jgi:ergothioneine biosynthesis protein EgtB